MTDVEKKVRDAVECVVGDIEDCLWRDDTNLDDFGIDSLDRIELVIELEDEFDKQIPEDTVDQFKTVGDLIAYFEQ